jgi:hypothetical protein
VEPPAPPALTLSGPSVPVPETTATATALNAGFGNALMTPRGAAMSSPKQQADREIKKVIKRLN